jgi:hypothetical protein
MRWRRLDGTSLDEVGEDQEFLIGYRSVNMEFRREVCAVCAHLGVVSPYMTFIGMRLDEITEGIRVAREKDHSKVQSILL